MLDRLWRYVSDLLVPPWAAGLTSMPGHDRVSCVDYALAHARREGFQHPSQDRRLRVVR